MRARFKGRVLVEGEAEGPAIVVDSISFYGDVDPERGVLSDGRSIEGKVLVARRSRGSTVGSYIIYALKEYGRAPKAIVMSKSEPIVIVGAVLAGIPLVDGLPDEFFSTVEDGVKVCVRRDGIVEVGCKGLTAPEEPDRDNSKV